MTLGILLETKGESICIRIVCQIMILCHHKPQYELVQFVSYALSLVKKCFQFDKDFFGIIQPPLTVHSIYETF